MYELRCPTPGYCGQYGNGCGPKTVGWLIPDKWYGVDFEPACNIHDYEYAYGTCRSSADFTFLKNMFRLIAQSPIVNTQQPLKRWRQRRAYQYYIVVRDYGHLFYQRAH